MATRSVFEIEKEASAMELAKLTNNQMKMPLDIKGLTSDSRKVKPGYLFAALSGSLQNGEDYIPQAIESGASVILTRIGYQGSLGGAEHLTAENPRQAFSEMVARFYEVQPDHIAAITGTNGKTSVADFARQIWKILDKKSASIGTLGINSDVMKRSGGLTTPDPVELHEALATLKLQGADHVALEASSHGLEQYRLDGVQISIAGFTNLTRDHLDYHGTLEAYFEAKLRLFEELLEDDGVAIINTDANFGLDLLKHCQLRGLKTVTIGSSGADLLVEKIDPLPEGQIVSFNFGGENYSIFLPLIGGFQAENTLMAAGIAIASGEDAEEVFKALSRLEGVPGRMEYAGKTPKGGVVFVDYAHTPDGLRTALIAARHHTKGKLSVVFGCGGDRDKGKRPEMGAIAQRLADRVYVTDDNPRTEDPEVIRREILVATSGAEEGKDRATAIHDAMQNLEEGDLMLLTGKGHEEGQTIGEKVYPFSDFEEVRKVISTLEEGAKNE